MEIIKLQSIYLILNKTDIQFKKAGWYFISMSSVITGAGVSANLDVTFNVNGGGIARATSWTYQNSIVDKDSNAFSIYLKQGDKIYFSVTARRRYFNL